ncbi:MAG: response regulator [Planctomycetales bacterium]|nr:response regulator [Planctomycetales bacterium]
MELTKSEWETLFPFHLALNEQLAIVSVGPGLRKLLPQLTTGELFGERFALERPSTDINSIDVLKSLANTVIIIRVRDEPFSLRGQAVIKANGVTLAVSPWISSPEQLPHLGLQLRDFALHDPTPELLFMMQGTAKSLQESRELSYELHQRSTQLQLAMHEARTASLAKSQFLANVSHELRTPMTAILGYAEMLLDELQDSHQREFVAVIHNQGRRLLAIMDDVLDLSRIESGKLTVQFEYFTVNELLRDTEKYFRAEVGIKPLTFRIQCHANIPSRVHTHRASLMQILKHLISNAIKFTPNGEIVMTLEAIDSKQGRMLQIAVTDTGIGIDLEKRHDLFQAFMQADDSFTRTYGGAGLGLAISRRLARMLGGDIEVTSELNSGSTFSLTVDCITAQVESLPIERGEESDSSGGNTRFNYPNLPYSIYVAEDADINRTLIKKLLELAGATATFGCTGRAAVQDITAEQQSFDLIIMDIQMPEMDGCTATRLIREAGINTPIIALTANGQEEDRVACHNAGANCFLTKPIDREVLYGAIADQIEQYKELQATVAH